MTPAEFPALFAEGWALPKPEAFLDYFLPKIDAGATFRQPMFPDAHGPAQIERMFAGDGPRLWRAVVAYTGDRELASDAVAEAFTLALERQDEISSLSGWVWRVAFRLASAELRSRRRSAHQTPADRPVDPVSAVPAEA